MSKKITLFLFLIISGCSRREFIFSKSISEWDGFDLVAFIFIIIIPTILIVTGLIRAKDQNDSNWHFNAFLIYILFILILATCSS